MTTLSELVFTPGYRLFDGSDLQVIPDALNGKSSDSITLSPTGTGTVTIDPATGGTVNNMALGGTTPAAATVNAFHLDTGTKTATATSGAATLNKMAGVITSESLTTAAGADYTLTLTNSDIAAADQVFASVGWGTTTAGTPCVAMVEPAAGSVKIVVQNIHATAAFNGTIVISFAVFKN